MADNTSLQQLELEKQKLVEIQKQLKATKDLTDAQKLQLVETDKAIKATEKRIVQAKQKVELQKLENTEFESFAKKFRGLSNDVQKQLQGTSKGASVYLSLGKSISKEKAIQAKYADSTKEKEKELLAKSYERESVMSDIAAEAAAQAKATQNAEDALRGISDIERQIKDIKDSTGLYNAIQKKQLIDQLNQTEQLRLKEERLKTIKEEQQGLFDALPDSIKGAVGFAKKLGGALTVGALPMVLLSSLALAALSSFSKLDESAKEFRETTGLTNSQMEGIRSQANQITGNFATLGVEAKDVFDTVAGLKAEFSDVAQFSDEVVAGLTVMSKNFGVSAESAAKVQGIFEQVGGLSSETATSLGLQVTQMANLAGVAPAKVMEDIAQSAEIASTLFRGDTVALAKNAIEARRLGTNLQSVASTAEKLLDFESGIGDELVAATFVGGQFNLNRARALAFEGKIVEAQKEVLAQVQRTGDFREKDYFTQQQLAKAAGMSVEEINKQINAQEKLNSLSVEQKKLAEDAMNAGLDISNIKKEDLANQIAAYSVQQEQQATLDKISNLFTGIASTVGTSLVPLLESVASLITPIAGGIGYVLNAINSVNGLLPALITSFGALYLITKKTAIMARLTAIANIFSGSAKLGPIGLVSAGLGVGALLGVLAANMSIPEPAGDMYSPANGKTVVSTREGGLFELSPNDDLVAAPGIASKMSGGQSVGNLGILSAPLNALLTEIKGLRADLNSGKVAVYMDTSKVTSTISRKVDQGTRNNFTLGTT